MLILKMMEIIYSNNNDIIKILNVRSLFQKLCPGNENNILNVQPWLYPRGIKFHFRAQFPSFSSGCNFLSTRVTNSGSVRARRRGSFKLFQDNFGGNEERSW